MLQLGFLIRATMFKYSNKNVHTSGHTSKAYAATFGFLMSLIPDSHGTPLGPKFRTFMMGLVDKEYFWFSRIDTLLKH